jgi:DsbC/DsbD-like thiol-disulfide interchange protein
MKTVCLSAAAALALTLGLPASAGGLPDPLAELEVLDGGVTKRGTYMAALRLTLPDGWKTYWRSPGEAGIPPEFSWRGSRNLGAVSFTWPAPEVFATDGLRSIGYLDELVLPLEITPADPGKPVRLKGRMEFGVCKDVCVPADAAFDHRVDAEAGRNPAIAAAMASRPYSAEEAEVQSASCRLQPIEDGFRVEARIRMPSAGGQEYAVIEPAVPGLFLAGSGTRRQGGTLIATAEFLTDGSAVALDRSQMRITVLGADHAVDITGC